MASSPDVPFNTLVEGENPPAVTPVVPNTPVPGAPAPDPTRWRALGVIAIAQLMVVLDASIVNLALPSAKASLGITDANQQWVITAYTLTFGGLLLLGGRVADYVGRKRAFMIGLIGFAAASALGGLAPNQGFLFASRGLQGAFAALLAPAALSLLTVTFHDPKERAKAFGVYGAISGGGAAIGLLLGGVLTEYLSWRWCLLVNAPIAIAAFLMAIPWVHESKAEGDTRYDIAGAVTATLGLVTLVYGFTKAAPKGLQDTAHWADSGTLVWFAAAAILLTSFFVIENRVANPLLPMRVLLDRNRGASYLVSLITGIGLFAMFLFLGLYLQVILHYSPVKAGFAFLPFSIGIILGAGLAANLLPRVGPKPLIVPGLIAGSVGLLMLTRLTPDSEYLSHVLVPMLIISVGMAFVFIPVSSTALHAIGHHDAGVASAMINTSQQVGGALGTALLNTVAVTTSAAYLTAHTALGRDGVPVALTQGYTRAFAVGAGFLFTAAIVAFFMLKVGKEAVLEEDAPAELVPGMDAPAPVG
jgi:EmrB/QacA subfamily drug resistance transporter